MAVVCGKEDPESHESLHETDAQPLAGKSTLNRFELGVVGDGPEDRHKKIVCDLARIEVLLGKYWVEMIDEPPSTVVLDFDATDIPLHGDQEDKFFHGY